MYRYKKLITTLIIVDILFVVGVLVLCVIADGVRTPDISAEQEDYGIESTDMSMASLNAGKSAALSASKADMFGESIYERQVIPSGVAMGIYMKTDGVLVVDICSFKNSDGEMCCPAQGRLQTGDYIVSVDGKAVSKRSEVLSAVAECGGDAIEIEYVRPSSTATGIAEKTYTCSITPETGESGAYLMGAWIKDDVSGIGTVTFVDGSSFMALGHSVSDIDTGLTMRCSTGGVYTTDITNISKSYISEPGRLQGSISYGKALVGIIDGNSESGIYGHLDTAYCSSAYGDAEKMYIARGSEVRRGTAYIYSRMTGELKKYEICIEALDVDSDEKNIEFEVTDDELLALTGGVVQGMSGSPVVQDGRLVGAVTHVFVDDPTRGYGIFIEGMLGHN